MQLRQLKKFLRKSSESANHFDPIQILNRQHPAPDHREIVIIGAGLAGVSMAWLLHRRGFKNIVILEAQERVGGKIYSYEHQGLIHEMGACYTQPAYHSIHHLLNHFDLNERVGVAGRMVYRDDGTKRPFGDDVIQKVKSSMGKSWKHLPKKAVGIRVVIALQRYKYLHRKLLGHYQGQLPPKPSDGVLRSLAIPFLDWLKTHRLDVLVPIFRLFQSAQGYGYLETVPAFYGLMWNTPEVIDIATQQMSGRGQGAALIRNGLSGVIEHMLQETGIAVHTQTRVTKISRQTETYVETKDASGQTRQWEAKQVIISAPHQQALAWLENVTPLEQELFSTLVSSCMTTTAQSAIQSTREKIDSWFDNIVPGRDHRVITQRCSEAFLSPETLTAKPINQPIERVIYQYGEQAADEETIVAAYDTHQVKNGTRNHSVVERCFWPTYFPHWPSEGIVAGNPWRLLDMQGLNNTWWIGSSACFESINDVFEYNLQICNRYLDSSSEKRLQR